MFLPGVHCCERPCCWLRPRPSLWRLPEHLTCRPHPRVPPPAPVRPLPAWATASAWAEAFLLSWSDWKLSAQASPFYRSFKSSVSPFIAYRRASSGKREVKLPSTARFISRAGVVTLRLGSFIKITCTRATYSATDSLTPISSDSNSRFTLSYAASSVSAAIFVSARHASEGDPISTTISMISFSFPRALVNACHAFSEIVYIPPHNMYLLEPGRRLVT